MDICSNVEISFVEVMEIIKKNVSVDFEALKKHARMNHWQMDEVDANLFKCHQ